MTDNEILLALSNIIEPVRTDIQKIRGKIIEDVDDKLQSLEARMDDKLRSLEACMDDKLQSLEARMDDKLRSLEACMDDRLQSLEARMDDKLRSLEACMDDRLQSLEARVDDKLQKLEVRIDDKLHVMDQRLVKIEFNQENDILPRLRTIEACYTSTYNRYKESVEEHDRMKEDISMLKDVVTEHSIKLQKIS